MPVFSPDEYIIPENVEDAVKILTEYGDKAKIIAGGTMIYELGERGMIPKVEKLVDIQKLGLDHVNVSHDGITVGSAVTIGELATRGIFTDPGLVAIQEALLNCGPEQIRNV